MATSQPQSALILSPLPTAKAFCGIDLLSFTASIRFFGIRNVPPGWHFVFTAADTSFSIRHGAWFYVNAAHEGDPEIYVKGWDAAREELIEGSRADWEDRMPQVWEKGLTPYRQSAAQTQAPDEGEDHLLEESGDWASLTNCITTRLLSRILGASGCGNHWSITTTSSAEADSDEIPGLSVADSPIATENELCMLPINLKQTWRTGAVGRERTEAAQDRSYAFHQLVEQHCHGNPMELVGELQFSYLMVLTLNNNSCLEQWKRLLGLLLTCVNAAVEKSDVFVCILRLLKLQLKHSQDTEGGLFDLAEEGGNMLKLLLKRFRKGLERSSGEGKMDVEDDLDDLEEYLKEEHGWGLNEDVLQRGMFELEDGERVELDLNGADEEEESGEYAPVIVDLTPEQLNELSREYGTTMTLNQKAQGRPSNLQLDSGKINEESEDDQDLDEMDARY